MAVTNPQPQLKRELGVFGATFMGLGSIVGTGVFVSIGIAAGIAGPMVIIAIFIGALVATFNGLNSAQLAASHPVSGGSYEYGYRYLTPAFGFTAGWMFLVAKTASAATAALGFAGYLVNILSLSSTLIVPIAFITVAIMTVIVLSGVKRSNFANTVIVSVTLLSLVFFILVCLPRAITEGASNLSPTLSEVSLANILQASALMFVAYTGYGRIATMGEEAKNPRVTIPRAMIVCLLLTMVLYITVAVVGIGAVGVDVLANQNKTAPLEAAVRSVAGSGASVVLAIGAMTAMLGVLLNLILGLSRVWLAMGRRFDAPRFLARLNQQQTTPHYAVILVGATIALLVLLGNVKTTWSFSAFSVLIYYAITNFAALKLSPQERLYPKWIAILGILSCLFLAFWVESSIWQIGIGLIIAGLIWHKVRRAVATS
ncbi:amino acid permease [Dulcicalothrix desertica PCC 7102]|uniref:Amino acid permease n=1 Tax=Dulcicalothrix desertica PCC 7102 TaxID=232991 RepID=A0A3S1CTB2_9CYAN|nr:APC family permease [Dulcicalothrix desertica]RUT10051.1 amino acid permease [Dulcicalothrix desertica PCC 7102]TWH40971.1 APA family basic amino acid/polyamine antiporter [Dulcicalothrix desertica PCC 7102]